MINTQQLRKVLCDGDLSYEEIMQQIDVGGLLDHIDAQAAEIARLRQPWQPIKTAPMDRTQVLLSTPSGKVADGMFYQRYGIWSWPYVMVNPTHWMPLPAPPAAEIGRAMP
ncbi:DUF551 domain-containing protein [Corticimicrobacter populi]|uniref:DUF551 domain-containing protein n=1 Tax=Corticimicrobacter populi TaxID=2175229 RepID=A0A2V1K180_9BURK|nr:DUF551 domain-containing protein [Corticimicrobacter populi]PWF25024.1 hypothetical protein DD235_02300 [Corticimicrobacter populi]